MVKLGEMRITPRDRDPDIYDPTCTHNGWRISLGIWKTLDGSIHPYMVCSNQQCAFDLPKTWLIGTGFSLVYSK